jgi:DNA mismatch endonuclease (patch repair protein)
MDVFDKEKRSEIMSRVKRENTKPERTLRSLLHKQGYRFRIHRRDLPGKPDVVLPKYKSVIFVHGCFWHRHPGCAKASLPSTNTDFWEKKFEKTITRDKENIIKLRQMGWRVIVVWECELKNPERVVEKLDILLKNA